MRVLLIHPEDTLFSGRWSAMPWDRVVDLGKNSAATYRQWEDTLGCPVCGLTRLGLEDLRHIREWAAPGHNLMVDYQGLDWWELFIPVYATALEEIIQLMRLAHTICVHSADVFITRKDGYAVALEQLLQRPAQTVNFAITHNVASRLRRGLASIRRAGFRDWKQILLDRCDPTFAVRRLLPARHCQMMDPVVLLPSAYTNVSRVAAAYARVLPQQQFLLIATRRSGHDAGLPANVKSQNLAAYAKGKFPKEEGRYLIEQWSQVSKVLSDQEEFRVGLKAGIFSSLPRLLRAGLATRDAWCEVFYRQPIQAVLCGDDSNPFTRMTVMLAQHRNLPAISFHHGALDFRAAVKSYKGAVYLAKSEMEYDYLVKRCGVAPEMITLGAPSTPAFATTAQREPGKAILFCSEPYEAMRGRTRQIYQEVLPELCRLAHQYQRKLVIKLHPCESKIERQKLIREVLRNEQPQAEIVCGELNAELLHQAWFAVTFSSSAAVECRQAGVPCFVAHWLDMSGYGYAEQYARYGLVLPLRSPSEISEIPAVLAHHRISAETQRQLGTSIRPELLSKLLTTPESVPTDNVLVRDLVARCVS